MIKMWDVFTIEGKMVMKNCTYHDVLACIGKLRSNVVNKVQVFKSGYITVPKNGEDTQKLCNEFIKKRGYDNLYDWVHEDDEFDPRANKFVIVKPDTTIAILDTVKDVAIWLYDHNARIKDTDYRNNHVRFYI